MCIPEQPLNTGMNEEIEGVIQKGFLFSNLRMHFSPSQVPTVTV